MEHLDTFQTGFKTVQRCLARGLSSLYKDLPSVVRKLSLWCRILIFLQTGISWLSDFRALSGCLQNWGRNVLLHTCIDVLICLKASHLPETSNLSLQVGLMKKPKAVPMWPSEESFMADFLTDLGARIGCGSERLSDPLLQPHRWTSWLYKIKISR